MVWLFWNTLNFRKWSKGANHRAYGSYLYSNFWCRCRVYMFCISTKAFGEHAPQSRRHYWWSREVRKNGIFTRHWTVREPDQHCREHLKWGKRTMENPTIPQLWSVIHQHFVKDSALCYTTSYIWCHRNEWIGTHFRMSSTSLPGLIINHLNSMTVKIMSHMNRNTHLN